MNNIIDQTTMTSNAIIGTTLEVASGKLKVRAAGITSNEMASNSVVTAAITDSNVTTAKIADSNVTTAKIADSNITAQKLNGAQTGAAPIYGVRAWVFFNGTTSPPTINASGNVTSVTKNAVGDYTVNFTTPLPNANYSVSLARSGGLNGIGIVEIPSGRSASAYRFTLTNLAVNANVDETNISATFIG
jgi:hypothetical protein